MTPLQFSGHITLNLPVHENNRRDVLAVLEAAAQHPEDGDRIDLTHSRKQHELDESFVVTPGYTRDEAIIPRTEPYDHFTVYTGGPTERVDRTDLRILKGFKKLLQSKAEDLIPGNPEQQDDYIDSLEREVPFQVQALQKHDQFPGQRHWGAFTDDDVDGGAHNGITYRRV